LHWNNFFNIDDVHDILNTYTRKFLQAISVLCRWSLRPSVRPCTSCTSISGRGWMRCLRVPSTAVHTR
jgi:hypothetical protein